MFKVYPDSAVMLMRSEHYRQSLFRNIPVISVPEAIAPHFKGFCFSKQLGLDAAEFDVMVVFSYKCF